MATAGSPARTQQPSLEASVQHIQAMARLCRENGLVVHVVAPRTAWVVDYARQIASEAGLDCSADLRAGSVRIRFEPRP